MSETHLVHAKVGAAVQASGLKVEEMACNPELADTAAFCEHYGYKPEQTCNAILVAAKTEPVRYVCCVILATCKLDVNKTVCRLVGVKRCSFATAEQTLAVTGMEIGGVTPVGIDESLPVFVDKAVMENQMVVLGGGNRSSKLLVNPSELLKLPAVQIVENLGLWRTP